MVRKGWPHSPVFPLLRAAHSQMLPQFLRKDADHFQLSSHARIKYYDCFWYCLARWICMARRENTCILDNRSLLALGWMAVR